MANGIKYQAHEILNKVLNAAETGLQVDIVAGAEYAEDSAHTSEDTGNFILGVRNDTLAALGGADGDYVPFQMNASGALYVEIAAGGANDSIYIDDADWSDGSSKHTLVGGLYQSSPQTITDGDVGPFQVDANGRLGVALSPTDNAVLDAMVVDLAAIEALIITLDGVQDNALTKLGEIETTNNANQVLLGTIDADTDAIKTDMAAIEVLLTAANVDHAANEALLTTIDSDTNDIKTDIAALEVLSTAANVDLAEIEVATEASQAALEKMLYGNALAVTAVHGGTTHALGDTYEALYVGVGGDAVVTMVGTGNFTFKNLASGQLLPIRFTHVINTNTTATNMIALKA
jgi:hypothetical protein